MPQKETRAVSAGRNSAVQRAVVALHLSDGGACGMQRPLRRRCRDGRAGFGSCVLGDAGGDQIYVETENSVYLLTFRAEPLRQMPHAFAAVTGSRHRKN